MKIIAIKPLEQRPGEYLLVLDDGQELTVHEDVLVKRRLWFNREVDERELKEAVRENEKTQLKKRALRYVTRSQRSTAEVRRFLVDKGYDRQEVEETLAALAKLGYLDDEAFVEGMCRRFEAKGKGRYLLRRELERRGIASDLIEKAVDRWDEELEFENCLRLARKKLSYYRKKEKLSHRLYHALLRQGFPQETVWRVLRQLNSTGELAPDGTGEEYDNNLT